MSNLINCHTAIFPWHLHPAQLYALGLEHQLSAADLLAAAQLSASDIVQAELQISWQQYSGMANYVNQYGPEDWSLQLGKRLTLASHGLLSLAVMSCKDWRQALDLMSRFKNLVTALFYLEKKETEHYLILELHPEFTRDPLLSKFVECFFTIVYQAIFQLGNFSSTLINNEMDFKIELQHAPLSYADALKETFHGNIEFSRVCNRMILNKRYLDMEIQSSNPTTANNMITMLKAQIDNMPNLTGELHSLHQQFRHHHYNQVSCAQQLHTSSTTLKRRLQTAQTTFNKELAAIRVCEANHMLEFSKISIEEISHILGFQDVGSFRRLFKQHTGKLPKEFR